MEKTISIIKKSQREEIRVGLSEFAKDGTTYNMAFARVYYDDGTEYRPGRNGINVRVELLLELIAALQQAEAEAQAAGLLKGSEAELPASTPATEPAPEDASEGDLTILGGG